MANEPKSDALMPKNRGKLRFMLYTDGMNTGMLDNSRFSRAVIPEKWVGEYGEKALGRYARKDEFIVLKPSFPVHLRYRNTKEKDSEWAAGGFDILLDEELLDDAKYGGRELYYYYLNNTWNMEIENQDAEKGDILMIKDSFSNVMLPYLALGVRRIRAWDMRHGNSVYEYLEKHPEIETVIIAYTISFVPTRRMNDFQ